MIVQTADRIRELREKNDMTQSELAKRLSITRSSVNAWRCPFPSHPAKFFQSSARCFILPRTIFSEWMTRNFCR